MTGARVAQQTKPLLSITNASSFFFRSHIRIYHVCSYLLPIPLSLHCPEKTKVSPADVVRFLVANGANTEAKDEDGMKLRCKI